ncbi:uncharacterized protein LOC135494892 [Lineus longissimus]|uniref:uncharacterized protein LOC135494892 n=1 Tax=Lineus longissimus TaxID=88925 RepID=UPI002B4EA804
MGTRTGIICAWSYATWMKNASRNLYKLYSNGTVRVKDEGMYYVYGQLIVYDIKPTASVGLKVRDPRMGNSTRFVERELTKCIETAGYLIGEGGVIADKSGSFRTCNMGSLTELYEGSEVFIFVHVGEASNGEKIPVKTFHNVTTAFFGMIKYT